MCSNQVVISLNMKSKKWNYQKSRRTDIGCPSCLLTADKKYLWVISAEIAERKNIHDDFSSWEIIDFNHRVQNIVEFAKFYHIADNRFFVFSRDQISEIEIFNDSISMKRKIKPIQKDSYLNSDPILTQNGKLMLLGQNHILNLDLTSELVN